MCEYRTIDANDSLSFFMGSWRELHLHEFELSDSSFSMSAASHLDHNDDNSSDGQNSSRGSSLNDSGDGLNNSPFKSPKKVKIIRGSRSVLPDDYLKLNELNNSSSSSFKSPSKKTKKKKKIHKPEEISNLFTDNKNGNNADDEEEEEEDLDILLTPKYFNNSNMSLNSSTKKKKSLTNKVINSDDFVDLYADDSSSESDSDRNSRASSKDFKNKLTEKSKNKKIDSCNSLYNDSDDEDEGSMAEVVENVNKKVTSNQKSGSNRTNTKAIKASPSMTKKFETKTVETKKVDSKTKLAFFTILNNNPYNGETIRSSNTIKMLCKWMKEYPSLCSTRYEFDAFKNDTIYPLHMLCAMAAPIICIKRCYQSYPGAINDQEALYGTPIHYASLFHYHYEMNNIDDENKRNSNHSCATTETSKSKKGKQQGNDSNKKRQLFMGGNSLSVIQYLVKKNANMLRILNEKSQATVFHLACAAPYFTTTTTTNVSSSSYKTDDDDKIMEKQIEIVRYLIDICPKIVSVLDKEKNTALHIACSLGGNINYLAIVKYICFVAPDLCLSLNKNGSSPLHLAIGEYHMCNQQNNSNVSSNQDVMYQMIKYLIQTNETPLRLLDKNGCIPLQIAIENHVDNIKIYQLLIKNYPECLESYKTIKTNETLYYYALKTIQLQNMTILELLSNSSVNIQSTSNHSLSSVSPISTTSKKKVSSSSSRSRSKSPGPSLLRNKASSSRSSSRD